MEKAVRNLRAEARKIQARLLSDMEEQLTDSLIRATRQMKKAFDDYVEQRVRKALKRLPKGEAKVLAQWVRRRQEDFINRDTEGTVGAMVASQNWTPIREMKHQVRSRMVFGGRLEEGRQKRCDHLAMEKRYQRFMEWFGKLLDPDDVAKAGSEAANVWRRIRQELRKGV